MLKVGDPETNMTMTLNKTRAKYVKHVSNEKSKTCFFNPDDKAKRGKNLEKIRKLTLFPITMNQ